MYQIAWPLALFRRVAHGAEAGEAHVFYYLSFLLFFLCLFCAGSDDDDHDDDLCTSFFSSFFLLGPKETQVRLSVVKGYWRKYRRGSLFLRVFSARLEYLADADAVA